MSDKVFEIIVTGGFTILAAILGALGGVANALFQKGKSTSYVIGITLVLALVFGFAGFVLSVAFVTPFLWQSAVASLPTLMPTSTRNAPISGNCIVPKVEKLDEASARNALTQQGFQILLSVEYNAKIPTGIIVSQSPSAGEKIPCQSEVTIVISLGSTPTPPSPSNTPPLSANTPPPTDTPFPPSPTPDPRLFWDDFETGLRPEWGITGSNFSLVNGYFVMQGGNFQTATIGDSTWHNYRIKIYNLFINQAAWAQISVRVQDSKNFMYARCSVAGSGSADVNCYWGKVVDGQDQAIPGAGFSYERYNGHLLQIEVKDNFYKAFLDNDAQLISLIDTTINSGGFSMYGTGRSIQFGAVEVWNSP
jgi:hypothetical protein